MNTAEEKEMPDPEPLIAPDQEPHPYPLNARLRRGQARRIFSCLFSVDFYV
jgi:hypothetical protein